MGVADPLAGEMDWDKKIKFLSDEELMDMWAETQALETALDLHAPGHDFPGASFERVIIRELSLRAERKNGKILGATPPKSDVSL